jgi:hypothetical protein
MVEPQPEPFANNPKEEPNKHLWVDGIVAARDKMPYIVLTNEHGTIAQLSIAQARQIAADIVQMAARTEADAMIWRFFHKAEFPDGAAAALMNDFREFRKENDEEGAEPRI